MSGRPLRPIPYGTLLVALAILSPAVHGQQGPPPRVPGSTGTLTRTASRYQDLEVALMQAFRDRNDRQIDRVVADDFEEWSAERAEAKSRDEWRRDGMAAAASSFRIRNLTVREFGDAAIVSFLLQQSGPPVRTSTVFIVDVWNASAGQLTVRYQSIPRRPAAP